jgi:tetratricopeptide (TPR) repeat protein
MITHHPLLLLLNLILVGAMVSCSGSRNTGNTHARQGVAAFQQENYVLAAQELEQATRLGFTAYRPEEIYTILGRTYEQLGRFEEAIVAHQRAVEANPNYYQAWVNLGIAYRLAGNLDEAEKSYKRALAIEPNYAELHASLGALYVFKDDPENAIKALQEAIRLDPQLAVSHANLALAYAMLGRFDEAEASLRRATALGYKNTPIIQARIDNLKALQE